MILNKSQAEAIYTAMCALNNVGNVRLDAFLEKQFHVREMSDDRIVVHNVPNVHFPESYAAEPEIYENQNAFREAYGIPE